MRIVIITVGSRGDLQPYVALGERLHREGQSVRVVTHAPFEELIRGKGLDFAPLGGDPSALMASMTDQVEPSRRRVRLPRRLSAVRDFIRAGRAMKEAALRDIPQMAENTWKASQDADALVLATFATFAGVPTARKLGIPAFVAHPGPACADRRVLRCGPQHSIVAARPHVHPAAVGVLARIRHRLPDELQELVLDHGGKVRKR